jgi:hypothetical protein
VPYVDPNTVHDPSTGAVIPAAWGDVVRSDLEYLVDPPACSVYHSLSVTKGTGTTLSALAANSENYDNAAMHSTSVSSSQILVPYDGRYQAGVVLSWDANASGNRATAFQVNGGGGSDDYLVDIRTGTSGNSTGVSGYRTLELTAGDIVEVAVWQNSGGNLDVDLVEFSLIFFTR